MSSPAPAPPHPPTDDPHPPPRSFSQPQFPYHFAPAPPSAAPSIREATIVRLSARPSTAHAPGNPQLGLGAFAPMCASARTSYTRVDQTAPGTPQPEPAELEDADQPPDAAELDATEKVDPEHAHQEQAVPQMPQVALTFLTITGKRRTMSFDPDATIGRVKELVWNAWPNEWQDERPPAPSYLRVLYLGKILQDEDTLSSASHSFSRVHRRLTGRRSPALSFSGASFCPTLAIYVLPLTAR
ncbi:ubiquitin-related domain-containing protein [Rhodofomes roseus]|uniref:Ubiquitin-related domain-containing protein n=1 Tax=Rhodofomes roseus TaxID=34475 RepID=A0ABQ8KDD0_9APHY|nr:ubiquitin-related domain-containing protein [Rhodofomes roseus]KAH9835114.1 ubiquitin-related domain-containing protein [Rhodofomes roseus]